MSDFEYVIRENGESNGIFAEDSDEFLNLFDILDNYPYIKKAMKNDNHDIEYDFCLLFDEILYENKVVGFISAIFSDVDTFILSEFYILPEFRNKKIFHETLSNFIYKLPNFAILQPSRDTIEFLKDYGYAKNYNDNIVVSSIALYFDEFYVKSSKNLEIDVDELDGCYFYDTSINSAILVEGDEVIYHDLLESDLKKYGDRKDINTEYFDNIKEFFAENKKDLKEFIYDLEKNLPDFEVDLDELLGSGDELSELLQALIDDDVLGYDEVVTLKNQIKEEYESGEIKGRNFKTRLFSLIEEKIKSYEFEKILESDDFDDFEKKLLNDFIDVIGDDEELGENIFQAILNDDFESFQNLLSGAADENNIFHESNYDDFTYSGYSPVSQMVFAYVDDDKHRLDATLYGKDYPISYDIDMYRFLTLLNDGVDFNNVFDNIEVDISSREQTLTQMLYFSGYIKEDVSNFDWISKSSEFTVAELKNILKENNLKVSGRKIELLQRLDENEVYYKKSGITLEGIEFLKDNVWIEFYEEFLNKFNFNDFNKFWDEHEGVGLLDIALDYLKQHLKLANKRNDKKYIKDCKNAEKRILTEGDDFIEELLNRE